MMADVHCPRCQSDAVYSYGRIKSGKQRYLCLICNHQFAPDRSRQEFSYRPVCPICRGSMHVYMRRKEVVRFRCADYPYCKGYEKITLSLETQ